MARSISPDEKTHRIATLYREVFDATESFEDDNVGADLAYLMGAIATDGMCTWDADRPLVALLVTLVGEGADLGWTREYIRPE